MISEPVIYQQLLAMIAITEAIVYHEPLAIIVITETGIYQGAVAMLVITGTRYLSRNHGDATDNISSFF